MTTWLTTRFEIDLARPRMMGIVNVTPDASSDGDRHADAGAAMAHCESLLAEGADILDIGGASTRPGARTPDADEELARVLPVLRHAVGLGVPVSVATRRPEVMHAALDPCIGFGKPAQHNLALLARQRELLAAGRPLLLGWSRKSMLRAVTGRPVGERLVASVAAALLAVERGAAILRVHDVAATVDALRVWCAAVPAHAAP